MVEVSLAELENRCAEYMAKLCAEHPDPSHDMLHVRRVVETARRLAIEEGADLQIVIPAAYLHDCVYVSKADARRSQASRLSADHAIELLRGWGVPAVRLPAIHHAIAAHSFSAGLQPETLEAHIVRDADRLDAMGAIGALRAFSFGGLVARPLYSEKDPFCVQRAADDRTNTLDHFYVKLLRLGAALHTASGKKEGQRRHATMQRWLADLAAEIG